MKSNIVSNVLSLIEKPSFLRFSLSFIDGKGIIEEYVFFDSSISQCVIKTIGLVNFMFRFKGMNMVYIFPTNSSSSYHNVYLRQYTVDGQYKIVHCKQGEPLTVELVRERWFEDK